MFQQLLIKWPCRTLFVTAVVTVIWHIYPSIWYVWSVGILTITKNVHIIVLIMLIELRSSIINQYSQQSTNNTYLSIDAIFPTILNFDIKLLDSWRMCQAHKQMTLWKRLKICYYRPIQPLPTSHSWMHFEHARTYSPITIYVRRYTRLFTYCRNYANIEATMYTTNSIN